MHRQHIYIVQTSIDTNRCTRKMCLLTHQPFCPLPQRQPLAAASCISLQRRDTASRPGKTFPGARVCSRRPCPVCGLAACCGGHGCPGSVRAAAHTAPPCLHLRGLQVLPCTQGPPSPWQQIRETGVASWLAPHLSASHRSRVRTVQQPLRGEV